MIPYKIEDGVSFFYLRDVEIYGCPSVFGYTKFYVIDADPVYQHVTYDENPGFTWKPLRLPHLYDRTLRFRVIVCQLLGYKFSIAKSVLKTEKWLKTSLEISDINGNYWFECRRVLKNNNFTKYYNCIPSIVREYCYFKEKVVYTENDFNLIMMTFVYLQDAFKKNNCGRKYFPNLRFVALKVMEFHKIPLQFPIPLLITKTKIKSLTDIFNVLVSDLQNV